MRETLEDESMEMAFALLRMRMVVLVHLVMRMDCDICASISTTFSGGPSKFSMIHLLPSSSFRGGFFVRMLSGFGLLPGTGDLPRLERLPCDSDRERGTAELARREGFLCVCCEGSTFRRLAVTDSPLESSSKMAPMSDGALRAEVVVFADIGGGGGGGGLSNFGSGGGGGGTRPVGLVSWEETSCWDVWPDST